MKRFLTLLLSLAIVATMMVVPVAASGNPTVTVASIEEATAIGQEVELKVTVANNPGFRNFDWSVRYDTDRLELINIKTTSISYNEEEDANVETSYIAPLIAEFDESTGEISAAAGNALCTKTSGILFKLVFVVKENAPSGNAIVEIESEIIDGNDGPLDFEYVAGSINVDGIDEETGGSTTGGSTTGGSTTGGSTTGGSTTGGSTTGGSTTGGSTTGGSTTGGSTTGGAVTSLGTNSQIKYTVTFENNGGTGIIRATVNKGETLEKPEDPVREGFEFIGWYVDAGLTKLYNFNTLVTGNFTLYAKWAEEKEDETETGTGLAFTDVNENDWFYEAVKFAFERNLVNGVSETEFAPNDKVTRAALVAILYRLEGEPATNKSIPYSDVAMDKYYANAVTWADQNEIINGISETEFAPEVNITREQIATIIYRYAKYNNYDMSVVETTDLSSFNDADQISDYAVDAMKYAVGVGIINGRSNAMLAPKDFASRAEFVQILYNFFK